MEMTFEEFARMNRVRCESPQGFNHPLGLWSTSDWITALVGEVGEAANVIKKLNRIRDGILNKETKEQLETALKKELGDIYGYFDLLTQSLGFQVEDVAVSKFNEVSERIGYKVNQ